MMVRKMMLHDRPYVVSTWGRSSSYRGMRARTRFKLIDRMMDTTSRVVCLATGDTVHAWAAGSLGVLDYVYVPPELRGNGLARQVITELLGDYPDVIVSTHEWPRPSSRFRFTPHALMRSEAA